MNRSAALVQVRLALEQGKFPLAYRICRQLLLANRQDPAAHRILGQIAGIRGLYTEAAEHLLQAIKVQPHNPALHCQLARIYARDGCSDKALKRAEKALALDAGYEPAVIEKARILERRGRYDQALTSLAPLLGSDTPNPAAIQIQAQAKLHQGEYQDAANLAQPLIDSSRVPPAIRRQLAFTLGAALDKLGQEREAMRAWELANALQRQPFDATAFTAKVDGLIEFFSADTISRLARATNRSEFPIFIAGMPRSGTTLVEQILASHPRASGVGEHKGLEIMADALPRTLGSEQPFPHCLRKLTRSKANRLATQHLSELARAAGANTTRSVNKNLENHRLLGLISRLFPTARVIYCTRDPLDTGLSIYASSIQPLKYSYAADLEAIGMAYRQHERIMEHWRQVLDLPIMELSYEALIADQEGVSRKLVEFCGLDWDRRCLEFHRLDRDVTSLSYHQVRKPLYPSSVGRSRRYSKYLEPLHKALSPTS